MNENLISKAKDSLNFTIIFGVIAFGLCTFSGSSTIFDLKYASSFLEHLNQKQLFLLFAGIIFYYLSFYKFKIKQFKSSESFFFFGGIFLMSPLTSFFINGFVHNDVYSNDDGTKILFSFILVGIVITLFQAFSYYVYSKIIPIEKEELNGKSE